ncbi:MAG: NAD-dependent epimerase [Myxococcota bacterium]
MKMKKGKTYLVTGTAGFIGFSVAKRLLEQGIKVAGVDNFNDYYDVSLKKARNKILESFPNFKSYKVDIADLKALSAVFEAEKPEIICHLAAQAGVRYSLVNPFAYERSNLTGFINVLELCRKHSIGRLVYASSSSVYGGNTKLPFSETDKVETPVSLYAATKRANELIAHTYTHLFGIQTIGLRFFTVYGPWGRPDMALWLFTDAILNGKPIKVFNHGDMERDFTYIDDIVDAVIASLHTEELPKYILINLGNNKPEKLLDFISVIEDGLNKSAKKQFLPMQAGDVRATYADIALAKQLLGFNPKTQISEGIPKFIKWFLENSKLTGADKNH